MIEWTPTSIEHLFEFYEQYFDRLLRNVAKTNVSLGSSNPKATRLERLTRAQFEAALTDPTGDKEAIELWLRRIIRGHENAFPARQIAG